MLFYSFAVCQWISSISNGFRVKFNRYSPTSVKLQNSNFLLLHSILLQLNFGEYVHLYEETFKYIQNMSGVFFIEKGLPNSESSHRWKICFI